MGKTETQIIQFLTDGVPLTLNELSTKLEKKPKTTFRSLRKLFQEGKIVCDPSTRRYALAIDK